MKKTHRNPLQPKVAPRSQRQVQDTCEFLGGARLVTPVNSMIPRMKDFSLSAEEEVHSHTHTHVEKMIKTDTNAIQGCLRRKASGKYAKIAMRVMCVSFHIMITSFSLKHITEKMLVKLFYKSKTSTYSQIHNNIYFLEN